MALAATPVPTFNTNPHRPQFATKSSWQQNKSGTFSFWMHFCAFLLSTRFSLFGEQFKAAFLVQGLPLHSALLLGGSKWTNRNKYTLLPYTLPYTLHLTLHYLTLHYLTLHLTPYTLLLSICFLLCSMLRSQKKNQCRVAYT